MRLLFKFFMCADAEDGGRRGTKEEKDWGEKEKGKGKFKVALPFFISGGTTFALLHPGGEKGGGKTREEKEGGIGGKKKRASCFRLLCDGSDTTINNR